MEKDILILEGKDYEKLVKEGMQHFNVDRDELHIEVLESRKNIFSSYYKLKISTATEKALKILESSINNALSEGKNTGEKKIEFEFREDGVYVRFEKNVTMVDIVTKIDLHRIQSADITKIGQAMEVGSYGNWIKIAEPQEEKKIDSECEVKLSKDFMEASVIISRPVGGKDIDENKIYEALKQNGVIFNINEDVVKNIVDNKLYEKEIVVAWGIEPIPGCDAVLEYHFDTSKEKAIGLDKDGRIDYRELSLIKNVRKGQKLVTLIPNTPGTPGKNVKGQEVPAKDGKRLTLPKGKNVIISDDGLELYSAIDGEVKLIDNKVSVFSVYEVKNDVDNSTGNIRFNGKVIVMGNVLTGFLIEAEGDVEVFGVVEGALIRSKGNIILHRGIQGMNKGELCCDGDLIAKFIENSKIEVKGNIQSDAIMHSQVYCGRKLEATGKKGLLVGGSFKVGEEIRAKTIGSPMATITELEVGVSPDMRIKYEEIKNEFKLINDNLDKTNKAIDLLTKMSKNAELPEDKKVMLSKSIKLKLQLQQNREQIQNELNELEEYFEDLARGKIRVYDVIYPGSRIIIGSSIMHIKDPVKYACFYRSNAEIKIGAYDDI